MSRLHRAPFTVALLLAALLAPSRAEAGTVEIVLLHLNDVYEITRPGPRDLGGLTRVAGLQKQLKEKYPNVVSILAGDFFSPSALGTAKVDGEVLNGKQMVAVLNAMKLDLAMFGNHEFDIPERPFLDRLKESNFGYFSGNITDAKGRPFPGVEPYKILPFKSPQGDEVRLGLIALTVETGKNKKDKYWRYDDYLATARKQVAELKGKADFIVAVTHLNLPEDQQLAREVKGIDLIIGGHEHENNTWQSNAPGVPTIFKADANVRTVWVHHLRFDTGSRRLDIESQLLTVSNLIPEDEATAEVVDQWVTRGFKALKQQTGHDPNSVVVVTTDDLEGREAYVRRGSTNLTKLIGQAMLNVVPGADLSVYNSGAIRIDDLIPAGPIRYYDILRILPYGGQVWAAEVKGSMLQKLFDRGLSPEMYGSGAFLQASHVGRSPRGRWTVRGKEIDPTHTYKVAVNDYLLQGRETQLSFFKEGPEVHPVGVMEELREAVIEQLEQQYPQKDKAPEPEKKQPAPAPAIASSGAYSWGDVVGLVLAVLGLAVLVTVALRTRFPGRNIR